MSVVHREPPVDSPHPTRSAVLEDILRDAACFATEEEAPKGLAYRALARQIVAQSALKYLPPVRASRKKSIGLWFGGLSAGTLAGGAAAVLVIANLNGSAFHISPEATALVRSAPELRESQTGVSSESGIAAEIQSLPRPQQASSLASAALVTVGKESLPEARFAVQRSPERGVPDRSLRWERSKDRDPLPPARSRNVASQTVASAKPHTDPPVARWKTEPFEETEYQLVTAAYTPEPTSGGYTSGRDHLQLSPLKMRASFDPSESDPMAGPSLPQY